MGQAPRPRPKRLAAKLRQIRAQLGLTQEQMAGRLKDIKSPPQPGHISEFESGRREPSLLFLLSVARLAGVTMEMLVDDDLDLPERLPVNPKAEGVRRAGASKSGRLRSTGRSNRA